MILLSPFKITRKTAAKIYEFFGPDSAVLLRKSFYFLCQIPGYGFKRVDDTVMKSNGDLHDPMRVQGALFYTLEQSRSEEGHLYMAAEKLLAESLSLLNEKIPQLDQRIQINKSLFESTVADWRAGQITARKAMEIVGLKPNTFYRRIKELNL